MDMTGIMPYEYHFYNPFNGEAGRSWGATRMTGLDLSHPIFVFRYNGKESRLDQLEYGLQWISKAREETWSLYEFDKRTGQASLRCQGHSLEDYRTALYDLQAKGVTNSDVAWGDLKQYVRGVAGGQFLRESR